MKFDFVPLSDVDARAVLAWHYDPPYDFYNARPEDLADLLDEMLDPENAHYAVRSNGELAGFCCFGASAQVPGGVYSGDEIVDVGLGLRPDLTGRGLGREFIEAILAFGVTADHPSIFRLTVAGFNRRAIRVYERCGFQIVHRFKTRGNDGVNVDWVQMTMAARKA